MDFALIEKLMTMLEASSLNELDVSEGGMRIRLAKHRTGTTSDIVPTATLVRGSEPEAPALSTAQPIAAGMAGTFYRSPLPEAPPFVEVGDEVREGDQLAIIEAMKMLNPVEADCEGVVMEILVDDGGSVEPGIVLFKIEKR